MSRLDYSCSIFDELSSELGLPDLRADADGRMSLTFDDMLVTLMHNDHPVDTVSIYVDLGAVPARGTKTLSSLLELNLLTWLRNNMTIGLDNDSGRAVGWNAIPVSQLSVAALREVMEAMLTAAMPIREALDQPDIAGSSTADDHKPPRYDPGSTRV